MTSYITQRGYSYINMRSIAGLMDKSSMPRNMTQALCCADCSSCGIVQLSSSIDVSILQDCEQNMGNL